MKKTIIIGTLLILFGGAFIASSQEVIPKPDIINFSPVDFVFTTSDIKFATTTDEVGNEIKTGIRIPITYDFPVATTTGFIVEQIKEDIGMTFDGYNMCRSNGKTQVVCTQELNDDIEQTVEAFKTNKSRELDELQRKSFQDELVF